MANDTWIALLDSDDIWSPDHLSRAVAALTSHGDFFSDGGMNGSTRTQLAGSNFDVTKHRPVDGSDDVFTLTSDFLALLVERTPFVTATVVFNKALVGTLRFDPWAGICDDLCFWISVASCSPRVTFSSRIEVMGGSEGEHISHIADWRSNKSLRLIRDMGRYQRLTLLNPRLSENSRALLRARATEGRVSAVVTMLAMPRHRVPIDWALLRDCPRESPTPVRDVLKALIMAVGRRMAGVR